MRTCTYIRKKLFFITFFCGSFTLSCRPCFHPGVLTASLRPLLPLLRHFLFFILFLFFNIEFYFFSQAKKTVPKFRVKSVIKNQTLISRFFTNRQSEEGLFCVNVFVCLCSLFSFFVLFGFWRQVFFFFSFFFFFFFCCCVFFLSLFELCEHSRQQQNFLFCLFSYFLIFERKEKWPAPSKLLASPPEERLPASPSPPR